MSFEDDIVKLLKQKFHTPTELAGRTGLSLASVYRIVDRISKKYTVRSRTFRVEGTRGPEMRAWKIDP